MNLLEQSQELIEISELVGREISIEKTNDELLYYGVLQSISNHGILIRGDKGRYTFFPWHTVDHFYHDKERKVIETGNDESEETKVEDKIEIVDPSQRIIDRLLTEDYSSDFEDDEEEIIMISDEEGEEVIRVDTTDPSEIEVFDKKDMGIAKRIAEELKIYKITRDF